MMAQLRARVSSFSVMRWLPWWLVLSLVAAGLLIYVLLGQQVISAIYQAESAWVDAILSGRAITPVEAYYRRADQLVFRACLWLLGGYAALRIVLREPGGTMIFAVSLAFMSFLLFCVFEIFPVLVPIFRLNVVSAYYAYKINYLPDAELGFREKPFNREIIRGFAGAAYSPIYGIDVAPTTIDWSMDQDGFRNAGSTQSADLVLLGDSYLDYGTDQLDTFGSRLDAKLPGISVQNLGKSGYSPFQYLVILNRYGLKYQPQYAVMAFYEGNDIADTRGYLHWKDARPSGTFSLLYSFSSDSLLRRYWAALSATRTKLAETFIYFQDLMLHRIAKIRGYAPRVHPEIAILNLQGKVYPKLFVDRFSAATTAEMLAREEFAALEDVFGKFRELCRAHGITPVVVYIPAAVHVYAKYSRQVSGMRWLRIRDAQIAASGNAESAVRTVVQKAGIDFLSLTPEFSRAAERGKMLYYALDDHWNADGREVAAEFLARALRDKYLKGERNEPRS
jgi:SGNH hydrolase-like domain, acetyltransferase AlgX